MTSQLTLQGTGRKLSGIHVRPDLIKNRASSSYKPRRRRTTRHSLMNLATAEKNATEAQEFSPVQPSTLHAAEPNTHSTNLSITSTTPAQSRQYSTQQTTTHEDITSSWSSLRQPPSYENNSPVIAKTEQTCTFFSN